MNSFLAAEDAEYHSLNLREVEIPVVSDEACNLRYGTAYNSTQHLCGGDWYNGKKDSCKVRYIVRKPLGVYNSYPKVIPCQLQ